MIQDLFYFLITNDWGRAIPVVAALCCVVWMVKVVANASTPHPIELIIFCISIPLYFPFFFAPEYMDKAGKVAQDARVSAKEWYPHCLDATKSMPAQQYSATFNDKYRAAKECDVKFKKRMASIDTFLKAVRESHDVEGEMHLLDD